MVPVILACTAYGAAPSHEMYLCASISSSSRVMGSHDTDPEGIFRRDNAGGFKHIGANLPLLISIELDPRDYSRIYAAGLSGVMRSTDGGDTWRICTGWDETEPKSVVLDPKNPDTVYAGLPDGIVVSHDQGQTWVRMEDGLPDRGKYTQCVQVDRTKGGRVFAGCEKGIFLSEDGARTWRQVFVAVDTVDDIQQSPHVPGRWLAVTQSAGALESRDGGVTWKKLPNVPSEKALYNVAFDPAHRGRLAIGSWTYGVLTSVDDGSTWIERNAELPESHRVWRVAVDPDSGRLYASVFEDALYESDDFGATWRKAGLEGSIVRSFTFVPATR